MRILYGITASILWIFIMAIVIAEYNIKVSSDTQFLSIAIIAAGAMAGGDKE